MRAALISLVRNEDLQGIVSSMRQLEAVWNSKYNYPWIFFNNVPFTEEFKKRTQAETKAECRYELIPTEHWEIPDWIDPTKLNNSIRNMELKGVKYASELSYHQMCRWFSGFFYRHPALNDIRYYWRVEPNVKFFCDIDYDVFRYIGDNNITYGFTINIYDDPNTLPSLWPETMNFTSKHPEYLNPSNSLDWLTDSSLRPDKHMIANGYSTCHFWSNFEIGDLQFWRSPAYGAYFDHLDRAGGFFYERWGDAPVHSIALGLFEDNSRIHWFRDIGYQHTVFSNCPDSPKCTGCRKNRLAPVTFWLNGEDCRVNWFRQVCKSDQSNQRHSNLCLDYN
ncbi:glycosyltransferase family 15 protein [Amorphotheca resinae ATCC 22711]|uniref:Glycosyltransferase family 15 protein n=1 Tax=Amorphotheca resinae ATCC 22711 TaxID=857342 RepID=A0A2T3B9I9_AMORE|nr:glycosyltransferase family 15 protein [Amorphotheca resinae ATCC 22711]PSS23487.1 glycosyltransferase family 15 protein [Amorphotheca resinae ATCC 22711]